MNDKRIQYRRYEDRRVAMMLALHEILFDEPPGVSRERMLLKAISHNYRVDRAAFVDLERFETEKSCDIAVRVGDWRRDATGLIGAGEGLSRLLSLHETAEGALSFESVRKPDLFDSRTWDSLWTEGIGAPARALLSIPIQPLKAPPRLLWLLQVQFSREWSSRDRDLSEEVVHLLTRAANKGV